MIPALARARLFNWIAAVLIALAASAAHAQSAPPAPAPDSAQAISERVRRDAERPYYWIRVNSQKAGTPAPTAAARSNPRPRSDEVSAETPAAAGRTSPSTGSATATAPSQSPTAAASPPSGRLTASAVQTLLDDLPTGAGAPVLPGALSTSAGPVALVEPVSVVRPASLPELPAAPAPLRPDAALPATVDRLALIHQVEPDFPPPLMQKLRKGSVEVRFDVGPEGLVTAATAVRSTHRRLEAAALDAVKAWRFDPPGTALDAVVELGFDLDR